MPRSDPLKTLAARAAPTRDRVSTSGEAGPHSDKVRFLEVEFTTEAGESPLGTETAVSRGGVENGVDWVLLEVFFSEERHERPETLTVPKVQILPQSLRKLAA